MLGHGQSSTYSSLDELPSLDPDLAKNLAYIKVSQFKMGKPMWASTRENLSSAFCAHPSSLIIAFVIHVLESTLSKLARSEI